MVLPLCLLLLGSVDALVFVIGENEEQHKLLEVWTTTGQVVAWNDSGVQWSHDQRIRIQAGDATCLVRGKSCQFYQHEVVLMASQEGFSWRTACDGKGPLAHPVRVSIDRPRTLEWESPPVDPHVEKAQRNDKERRQPESAPLPQERSFVGKYLWLIVMVGILGIQLLTPKGRASTERPSSRSNTKQ